MRVTSDLWVSALIRRVFAEGGFAAVERRGATEAGAIYVRCRDRMGQTTLLGPAPQVDYDEARPSDRLFSMVMSSLDAGEIEARLARELRFDPDLWIVEIEVDAARLEELVPQITP